MDIDSQLEKVSRRYDEINALLCSPEISSDSEKMSSLLKEQKGIEPIVSKYREYRKTTDEKKDCLEIIGSENDQEMKELAKEELRSLEEKIEKLENELKILLIPKDPNDGKNIILEIRCGAGGEESALFASDLLRMYLMYNDKCGFKTEILNLNETELGGVKEASVMISGADAYSRYKFESGVHRVQRVPQTESGGRIHTSTATVSVLPEAEKVDFELDPADLKFEVFRSSGAGGQKVNKTSSAVRVIHIPTGMVVECQVERSQYQNKDRAVELLRTRLYNIEQEKKRAERDSERHSQVGTGDRSEKIRTYNFPQDRVTDHRIGLTVYGVQNILNGNLDSVIDALISFDTAKKLENGGQDV
jgi:peptide chain release factor 1